MNIKQKSQKKLLFRQNTFNYEKYKHADEETVDFTVSLATEDLFDHMNGSSVPAGSEIDEFELAGLKPQIGKFVSAPFVSDAAAALECTHWKTIDLPNVDRKTGKGNYVIFGQGVGIYINDKFIYSCIGKLILKD